MALSRSPALCLLALDDEAAHTLAGAVDAGLDRTHGHVEFLGYLLVGEVVDETHDEESPVLLRQQLDVALDLRALLRVDEALLGRGGARCRRRELAVDGYVLLTLALEVDMRILGYGVEPLPEGIFGRVAVEVGIYLYERLLQQVVRILGGCRTLQEQTPYGVAVAVEEVFECRMVALSSATM